MTLMEADPAALVVAVAYAPPVKISIVGAAVKLLL